MRQFIIAGLVAIFGPIAILILERYMISAPEWIWRLLSTTCIIAGVIIAILSNPIYSKLKNPQTYPIFSTIIVAISAAIIFGGIWWFIITPKPKLPTEVIPISPKPPSAEEIAVEVIKHLQPGLIPPQQTESPTFKEKPEIVSVSFGGRGLTQSISFANLQKGAVEPINFGGYKPIRFYLDKDRLFADVSIYGGKNKPPIEVKHNEFTVRILGFDRNFDPTALEIVNENQFPIFQLIYKTPYQIIVNGIFPSPSGLMLASDDGFFGGMPFIPKSFRIKRLFKYPSNQFLGQRAEIIRVVPSPHLKERTLNFCVDLTQFINEREKIEQSAISKSEIHKAMEQTFSLYDSKFAIKCSDIAEELEASGLNVGDLPSDCRGTGNFLVMKDVVKQLKYLAEQLP